MDAGSPMVAGQSPNPVCVWARAPGQQISPSRQGSASPHPAEPRPPRLSSRRQTWRGSPGSGALGTGPMSVRTARQVGSEEGPCRSSLRPTPWSTNCLTTSQDKLQVTGEETPWTWSPKGGGLLVQGLARQGLPPYSLGPSSPCDPVPSLGHDQGRPALGVLART